MKLDIKKLGLLCAMMAMAFLSTGCQTTGRHVAWYDGPPMTTNQIALLKVQRDFWTVVLTVDKIDGRPLAKGVSMRNNTAEIELLPGQHDLEVAYRDSDGYVSKTNAKISFDAEMGKSYELLGGPRERSFGKAIVQGLTFQDWYWTLWIVDAQSKKVIVGTPRATPWHWYE